MAAKQSYAVSGVEPRPVSPGEFARFRKLIHRESGIHLGQSKHNLLARRLRPRLRELGFGSYGDYYLHVVESRHRGELRQMLDCICTNETRFFREPRQFAYLEQEVLPRWLRQAAEGRRPRAVRAWSAACSTGEEPFSLAMTLRHHFPRHPDWNLQVLATDLSTRVLGRARAATWPIERAAQIPPRYLKEFCLRGRRAQLGKIRARDEIRDLVRFARLNLNAPAYPHTEPFDLILCRNVLIYFDPEAKAAVIDRLLTSLAPGGLLLVGHAESLVSLTDRVELVAPTIYRAAPAQ